MHAKDSRMQSEAEPRRDTPRNVAFEAAMPGLNTGSGLSPQTALALQRSLGNAGVSRVIEQSRHQHGAGCGHTQNMTAPVQRSAVHNVLNTNGQPLDDATRTDMESRLGADFSDVRVHTDGAARASAAEVGAHAYTSGNHVVIGDGGGDKHTLAHELTHVIQQRQGPVAGTDNGSGLRVSDPSDRFERQAEANATRVLSSPAPVHPLVPQAEASPQGPAPVQRMHNGKRPYEGESEEGAQLPQVGGSSQEAPKRHRIDGTSEAPTAQDAPMEQHFNQAHHNAVLSALAHYHPLESANYQVDPAQWPWRDQWYMHYSPQFDASGQYIGPAQEEQHTGAAPEEQHDPNAPDNSVTSAWHAEEIRSREDLQDCELSDSNAVALDVDHTGDMYHARAVMVAEDNFNLLVFGVTAGKEGKAQGMIELTQDLTSTRRRVYWSRRSAQDLELADKLDEGGRNGTLTRNGDTASTRRLGKTLERVNHKYGWHDNPATMKRRQDKFHDDYAAPTAAQDEIFPPLLAGKGFHANAKYVLVNFRDSGHSGRAMLPHSTPAGRECRTSSVRSGRSSDRA
ncbi:DUF4157 domain-containing protein [Streptacidiphilus sp. 4-A2]|nr:DUF4157 domain-containing protein [Streptacidiphilus sp. 4-A2]